MDGSWQLNCPVCMLSMVRPIWGILVPLALSTLEKNTDFWVTVINPRVPNGAPSFWSPLLAKSWSVVPQAPVSKEATSGWLPRYMHIGDLKKVEWIRQRVSCCIQPDHLNTARSFQHQKAKECKRTVRKLLKIQQSVRLQVVTITVAKMKETPILMPKWP